MNNSYIVEWTYINYFGDTTICHRCFDTEEKAAIKAKALQREHAQRNYDSHLSIKIKPCKKPC